MRSNLAQDSVFGANARLYLRRLILSIVSVRANDTPYRVFPSHNPEQAHRHESRRASRHPSPFPNCRHSKTCNHRDRLADHFVREC
ncbi:hypothetical protein Ae201684P_019057 [Aphanomyces euteiches]|uniref:Uncharacterized protein n=1 Tax=Aphanomyces euteiches TaxID=100861 RepID=A0A6G0WG98_9STRA|nr:hypothetical protein Ae201684_015789 [Aphanomyces euteiches]KAH9100054.1 hypothetical protein Ae201684P_019057 [Aphanomyces euteiches]